MTEPINAAAIEDDQVTEIDIDDSAILDQELGLVEVGTEPTVVTPGMHPVEIIAVTLEKGNDPPHNPYLMVRMTITDGPDKGRQLRNNLMLMENYRWRIKRALLALGYAPEEVDDPRLTPRILMDNLPGCTAIAQVEHGVLTKGRNKGRTVANIRELFPAEEDYEEAGTSVEVLV